MLTESSMRLHQCILCVGLAIVCLGGAGLTQDKGKDDPFDPSNERKATPAPQPSRKTNLELLTERLTLKIGIQPAKVQAGQIVQLTISGRLAPGAHTYPLTVRHSKQIESQLSALTYTMPEQFKPLYPIKESEAQLDKEHEVLQHALDFTWTQDLYVDPQTKPGVYKILPRIRVMACTTNCTNPDIYPGLEAFVEVLAGDAAKAPSDLSERLKSVPIAVVQSTTAIAPGPKGDLGPASVDRNDLWALLGAAFLGAFLMLLTPCVFPMIPITVNFFIKQSEKEHHRALPMASAYSGTIIVLLTIVMLVLGKVVIELANDPWFNLALGGVLVFFALSLFGMYEIELPSFLARYTSSHEGRGGLIGTVFMALTFTITSFTCTGPFLGIMLAPVAGIRPPLVNLILAALVYSTTFAAPFFLLALFPTVLKKLPKSGGWMNVIKVTMGFLELGAALKFLANSDYFWNPGNPRLFNFDTVLCAWIALSVATGLYLFGVFRLPHDDPPEHIGVVRMIVASMFMGLAVYMTPVLFGIKPKGFVMESIIAFLPPQLSDRSAPRFGGGPANEHLSWHLDYEDAWKQATKENKLVFIDFTGVNCTNCRDNEKNVFPRPEVVGELKKYVRVQLYTDTVPNPKLSSSKAKQQADRNSRWRDEIGDPTNPTYVIFAPAPDEPFEGENLKGRVIDRRNGSIFDVPDFVQFLQKPVKTIQTAAR